MTAIALSDRSTRANEMLRLGDRTRIRRAQLRQDIKTGRVDPRRIIARPPAYVLTMPVFELMQLTPRYRRMRTVEDRGQDLALRRLNMAAAHHNVNLFTPLGELTPRQREWLIAALDPAQGDTN